MRTLYFDCFSGAAGDMILGALIDVGVPIDEVRSALGSLAIAPDTIWTERVSRAGVQATKFCVRGEEARLVARDAAIAADVSAEPHRHGPGPVHQHGDAADHSHVAPHGLARDAAPMTVPEPPMHGHRTLEEIRGLIARSRLSTAGRARAVTLFERLADTEAAIHGVPVDQVHLHEVGALDSIIDIVGTVHAMEVLGVDRVECSPLNVGGGFARTAHGLYPVPAPATTRLLRGAPIYGGTPPLELVTPTGALLVTDYASAFGAVPAMRLTAVGYGAGTRDLPGTPNVVRVLLGESDTASAVDRVVVIEANIDDMNPQFFGPLMDDLLSAGALDVFLVPAQMKKNRPGTLLTVVAPPDLREALTAAIFSGTTTIGVRYRTVERDCLERETVPVVTSLGPVRIKVATRDGRVVNAAPEFDDCLAVAQSSGRPLKDIQALALVAFYDRQLSTPD